MPPTPGQIDETPRFRALPASTTSYLDKQQLQTILKIQPPHGPPLQKRESDRGRNKTVHFYSSRGREGRKGTEKPHKDIPPIKRITHKYKNKQALGSRRAEVVLGTLAMESLVFSGRWGGVTFWLAGWATLSNRPVLLNECLHTIQVARPENSPAKSNLHSGDKQFALQIQKRQAQIF